ncbi:hypothetical protein FDP41_001849 [Naegleria fowleri]|uniref:Mitochondrial carrier protein n=1 Tax=Naegleria fowleri TaxID=5763 RepID=A0A6A5C0S5_NAEFO|nr:uncharacterized protein FDP41_001849 [Naegleria fowleri]KAF0978779.1 hypothetical protein FDP41_001849 [Naegleria fowleri]
MTKPSPSLEPSSSSLSVPPPLPTKDLVREDHHRNISSTPPPSLLTLTNSTHHGNSSESSSELRFVPSSDASSIISINTFNETSSSTTTTASSNPSRPSPSPPPPPPSFEITWQNLDKFKYYSIGLAATSTTLGLFYPFDLIKTHQQMNSGSSIKQISIFKNLWKNYGLRGLYKGFAISLLGACSIESLYMSTYEIANQEYLNRNTSASGGNGDDEMLNSSEAHPTTNKESDSKSFNRYFLAGLSADIIANTLVVPFDVISQRMMISKVHNLSSIHIIRDILKKEGFRGLYRGYTWSLCKFAPESALWWGIYGLLRKKYFENFVIEESQRHGNSLIKHQLFSSAVSGILAGVACAIVFNPLDVIKTRLQTFEQKMTFKQVITELHRSDGLVKGLSKGILPNIIFMASTSSLSITVYELVKILSKTS